MVYDLDPIPARPNFRYGVDYTRSNLDHSGFSRVAYFVELHSQAFGEQWVWVSMDTFTDNAAFTGVPCLACEQGAIQQFVSNVRVVSSNVPGLSALSGADLAGNIEFWPYNYGRENVAKIPGATGAIYDSGVSSDFGPPLFFFCLVYIPLQLYSC